MREAGSGPLRRWHSRAALAPAVLAAALVVMGVRGERRLDQPYDVQRERRADAIGRDLRRLVGPRETVQGMGFAAAPALLRLGLRQPTRFLGDFVFFLDSEDPRTRALRAEFVAGLEAGRPAAIVVLPERGAGSPFARLDTFPALTRLLEQRYTVAVEGWGYRIYGRRPGP